MSNFGNLISGLTSKMGGLGEGITGIISKLGSLSSSGSGIPVSYTHLATTITTISSRKADSQMDFFRHKSEVKFG